MTKAELITQIAEKSELSKKDSEKALAAVGSSFTLMTFITSIILGLCIGKRSIVFYQIWAEGRKWS